MTQARVIWVPPTYPGDRRLARLGAVDVGAVFPPVGTPRDRHPWVWRCWLAGVSEAKTGRANTEQAARNALLACVADQLRKMNLTSTERGDDA